MSLRLILSSSILLILLVAATATVEDEIKEAIDEMVNLSYYGFLIRYRPDINPLKIPARVIGSHPHHYFSNLRLMVKVNKAGLPYSVAINKFADYSDVEIASFLGVAQTCSTALKGSHKLTEVAVPDIKDWRDDGIVSPVKEQGDCASGWVFSATGAVEAAYHQAFGKGISLSEQHLVDCVHNIYGSSSGFPFQAFETGCSGGGLPSQAFEFMKHNGAVLADKYKRYNARVNTCQFSDKDVRVKVLDYVNITWGAEDELKHAVGLVRPVSVAFKVDRPLLFYKRGVYTSSECVNSKDLSHVALAVGYGVENGIPYWLIKNSWGTDWGDNGYFKMEMGKNICGIAECASYPIVA